ncbi:MAG TPA: Ig-like domain-containing protein, partial [Armatimonadota bacterium]|nr:Ig-like domain-containing protein [Armatimonadota bacterium]
ILLRTRWSGYCTLPVSAPDGDQDGLSDTQEKIYGLDPARADSDGDGLRDGNDPAPLFAFVRPKEQDGPTITGIVTPPHTPPAGGKSGKIRALVFDPAGVTGVTLSLSADGRSLGGGAMQEAHNSQVFEYNIPPLTAGQQLSAVLTATNGAGKVSTVKATFPVTIGVRITSPLDNILAKNATPIRLDVSGKPAYLQILVNGYPVTKLTQAPYRYVWDPFPYQSGTHEILVEAYDAENHLIDADAVRIRYTSSRDHR